MNKVSKNLAELATTIDRNYRFYQTLRHKHSLDIINLLDDRVMTVSEICDALPKRAQCQVSQDLARLRQSGIVSDERSGQYKFYRLSADFKNWLYYAKEPLRKETESV